MVTQLGEWYMEALFEAILEMEFNYWREVVRGTINALDVMDFSSKRVS